MLRRTLTILSLIGLLLSVGLWGVSYFHLSYTIRTPSILSTYAAVRGGLEYSSDTPINSFGLDGRTRLLVGKWWKLRGLRDLETKWVPSIGEYYLFIPLWIPSVLFSLVFAISCTPILRRRKRKKLGLCVKCSYDLRGSKDRCPECGTGFSNQDNTEKLDAPLEELRQ